MRDMRYGDQVENKAPQRERLEEDVKRFLQNGGKIIKVSKGNEDLLAKRPRSAIHRPVNL